MQIKYIRRLAGIPANAIPAEARGRRSQRGGRGGRGGRDGRQRQAAALRRPRRAGLLPGSRARSRRRAFCAAQSLTEPPRRCACTTTGSWCPARASAGGPTTSRATCAVATRPASCEPRAAFTARRSFARVAASDALTYVSLLRGLRIET